MPFLRLCAECGEAPAHMGGEAPRRQVGERRENLLVVLAFDGGLLA